MLAMRRGSRWLLVHLYELGRTWVDRWAARAGLLGLHAAEAQVVEQQALVAEVGLLAHLLVERRLSEML